MRSIWNIGVLSLLLYIMYMKPVHYRQYRSFLAFFDLQMIRVIVFYFEDLDGNEEDSAVDEDLYNLVTKLQIHSHTQSCQTKVVAFFKYQSTKKKHKFKDYARTKMYFCLKNSLKSDFS